MGLRLDGLKVVTAIALSGLLAAVALIATSASAGSANAGPESSRVNFEKGFLTSGDIPTLSRADADDFWTAERLESAKPLDLPGDTADDAEREAVRAIPGSVPFDSVTVGNTLRYPNRVHGKLFGEFPGLGLYTCSATLTTSGSGSLLTTAGHCVYDPQSGIGAGNLVFAPGYRIGIFPYGLWPVTNYVTTGQWGRRAALDYDFAMMRVVPGLGSLQQAIGSRGIGFNQNRKQRIDAYGYPGEGPSPDYNGENLIRCGSGHTPDRLKHGGPKSLGLRCDMQGGSSGGGFVAQNSHVVSVVSHGHLTPGGGIQPGRLYGPYFGSVAKTMYKANLEGFPSIGPIGCLGKVADIIGTLRQDKIKGSNKGEVIATLGGNDRVKGGGGRDIICAGEGPDKIIGGGGKDVIDGGGGNDRCGGAKGNDKLRHCEVKRKPRTA